MNVNYESEPIVILTQDELIEGVLYRPEDIRFSDVMNASAYRSVPFLAMRDARIFSRERREEILRTNFVLVARERIICVMPKADTMMNWDVFSEHPSDMAVGVS